VVMVLIPFDCARPLPQAVLTYYARPLPQAVLTYYAPPATAGGSDL